MQIAKTRRQRQLIRPANGAEVINSRILEQGSLQSTIGKPDEREHDASAQNKRVPNSGASPSKLRGQSKCKQTVPLLQLFKGVESGTVRLLFDASASVCVMR